MKLTLTGQGFLSHFSFAALRSLYLLLLTLLLFFSASGQVSRSQIEIFAADLVDSKSIEERKSLLASRKEMMTVELGKELIKHGNMMLLEGRYAPAFDVYVLARDVADQIRDKEGLATASLDLGTVLYFQGSYDKAIQHYTQARQLFSDVPNQMEAAKALFGLALIYKEQQNNVEALKTLSQALREFESLDDKEQISNTLDNMATLYYAQGDYAAASKAFLRSTQLSENPENTIRIADAFYMQGEYTQALDYYQRSLKNYEEKNDEAGMVGALNGAANTSYYQGKYDEALGYFEKNLALGRQLGDATGVASSLQGIGNVHRAQGDFSAALQNYYQSLDAAESSELKVPTANTFGSIGLIKVLQGEQREAFRYFKKSLDQFQASGDKVGMARMLANIGNAKFVEGNFEGAIDHYQKSLALREAMNDVTAQANLFVGLGTVHLAQKEFAKARDEFQKASAFFERLVKKEELAETQAKLAEVALDQGDYQQALKEADASNRVAASVSANSSLWYGHLIAGKAFRGLNQVDSAAKEFGECIASIESSSLSSMSEPGNQRSNLLPYIANVEMLIDQNKPGEAFEITERSRVQAHRDLLGKSVTRIQKGLSAAEVANESNLLREVTALALQLDMEGQRRNSNPASTEVLRKRLQQAQNNYEKFRRALYVAHPQLKVLRGEMSPLKFEEARNLIGDAQTALLEYLVTDSNVYLFVLTLERREESPAEIRESNTKKNGPIVYLKVYPLNITPNDLTARIAQVRQSMISRDDTYRQPSRELYDLLIKPAEPQLKNKTRLVIVPDGLLWRVPFEVLQPTADVFLVDKVSTIYASSLTALREMKKLATTQPLTLQRRMREKSGGKKTSGQVAFVAPLLSEELLLRLSLLGIPVPAVDSSAENKKEAFSSIVPSNKLGSRVYIGADASEAKAKLETGSNDILYFDAPANLDDASPMYSFVALASGEPRSDDGLLHSWEIVNLRSQSRLVVLSGSTSSNERPISGAAVSSLAWSWFVAGAPSTLLTRWQVPTPGRTQMLSEINKRFQAGTGTRSSSLAETIRQSVLSLRHSTAYQHPYYWSGFMLMGEAR